MPDTNRLSGRLLFFAAVLSCPEAIAEGRHPNVVMILADDLGSIDLNCYGAHDLETPALDRLASRGTNGGRTGPQARSTSTIPADPMETSIPLGPGRVPTERAMALGPGCGFLRWGDLRWGSAGRQAQSEGWGGHGGLGDPQGRQSGLIEGLKVIQASGHLQ